MTPWHARDLVLWLWGVSMVINMQVSPCAVVHNFVQIKMILSSFDLQSPSPTCVIDYKSGQKNWRISQLQY